MEAAQQLRRQQSSCQEHDHLGSPAFLDALAVSWVWGLRFCANFFCRGMGGTIGQAGRYTFSLLALGVYIVVMAPSSPWCFTCCRASQTCCCRTCSSSA